MNNRPFRVWIILAAIACGLACVARAEGDDVEKTIQSLFGRRIQQVLSTKSTADDAQLGGELWQASKELSDAPALQVRLYELAIEFAAAHPGGDATVVAASKALGKAKPDRRSTIYADGLSAFERCFSRAERVDRQAARAAADDLLDAYDCLAEHALGQDEQARALKFYRLAALVADRAQSDRYERFQAKADAIVHRAIYLRDVRELMNKLAVDRDDVKARRLIVVLAILHHEDLQLASTYAVELKDEQLKAMVALAGKSLKERSEEQLLTLGHWLHGQASSMPEAHQKCALVAARDNLDAFITRHKKTDARRLKAHLALKRIADKLSEQAEGDPGASETSKGSDAAEDDKKSTPVVDTKDIEEHYAALLKAAMRGQKQTVGLHGKATRVITEGRDVVYMLGPEDKTIAVRLDPSTVRSLMKRSGATSSSQLLGQVWHAHGILAWDIRLLKPTLHVRTAQQVRIEPATNRTAERVTTADNQGDGDKAGKKPRDTKVYDIVSDYSTVLEMAQDRAKVYHIAVTGRIVAVRPERTRVRIQIGDLPQGKLLQFRFRSGSDSVEKFARHLGLSSSHELKGQRVYIRGRIVWNWVDKIIFIHTHGPYEVRLAAEKD